jgi:hypothetical protein
VRYVRLYDKLRLTMACVRFAMIVGLAACIFAIVVIFSETTYHLLLLQSITAIVISADSGIVI